MNLDRLSIMEPNERRRAVNRWIGGVCQIQLSSQGIGRELRRRGMYLLDESTVVPFGSSIDGDIWETSISYPRFLSGARIRGRIRVNRWQAEGSWSNPPGRCAKPWFARR